MTIGERIKKLRCEKMHMSQVLFADKINVSKQTLYKYENNIITNIPSDKIESIANLCNVSPAYLMGWEEDEELMATLRKAAREAIATRAISEDENVLEALEKYMYGAPLIPKDAIPVPEQSMLAVLGKVSAGHGSLAEEEVLFYESADSKYINGEYFYLKVKGDSMSPQIAPDDLVLVKHQTSVDSGDIAVVIVDDMDGMVKKVVYDEKNIHLVSFNPYYPEKTFSDEDVQRVRIIGKVVESKRKW